MHIFFSVGEPSGDQHAACLIEELKRRRPNLEVSGFGGPLMQKAGCRLLFELTNLAVMGFLRVIPMLGKFISLVGQANQFFRESRPDAVVLVDFPGFNWWIARKAKAAGIPVFYYLPPQLWAWAPWRIRRMRKFVDHVLCGLPFEPEWYAKRGMQVDYVGHPFFDEVDQYPLDSQFLEKRKTNQHQTIGILPGSRNQEITRNWALMIEVIKNLHRQHPQAQFLVACYKKQHQELISGWLEQQNEKLPVHLFVGKTPEIIEAADCCLMVSGSVSLEMLARRTPAVVLYRCGPLFYSLIRPFVRLGSITLPNLIAQRMVFPEWVVVWFPRRDVQAMTDKLDGWLKSPQELSRATAELASLCDNVVQTGATERTAETILARLEEPAAQKAA